MEKQAELERTGGGCLGAGKRQGPAQAHPAGAKADRGRHPAGQGGWQESHRTGKPPLPQYAPDGLCRLDDRHFSKTIAYADVSYRLAGPDDQRDIFERLCDFYNGYDPSIGVQMTLSSSHKAGGGDLFRMAAQGTIWMGSAPRPPASCKRSMSAAATAM